MKNAKPMANTLSINETYSKGLKRTYEVTVPAAVLEVEIDKQLKQVGKRVKIPGFRPGKIPSKVLRQRYGKSVMGDVLNSAAGCS
jgi:trigger factor